MRHTRLEDAFVALANLRYVKAFNNNNNNARQGNREYQTPPR